jgi:2-phospho-L-lactate guanylyltransferase
VGPRADVASAPSLWRDTLCAAANASRVQGALVVACDRSDGVESFTLPGVTVRPAEVQKLNASIRLGMAAMRATHREVNVASLPGDLPSHRSSELDLALAKADGVNRSCVPDHAGEGTTLLTTAAGHYLKPA